MSLNINDENNFFTDTKSLVQKSPQIMTAQKNYENCFFFSQIKHLYKYKTQSNFSYQSFVYNAHNFVFKCSVTKHKNILDNCNQSIEAMIGFHFIDMLNLKR